MWGRETPFLVQFDENGRKVSIKKIHNVFGHLMCQATYEGLRRIQPNVRPFILTRAGFSGTQRFAASWTGDNVATFEHLAIAIRMCQSMGLSGVPFIGADVGGFNGSPSTELFVRWIQVGAFTPLFRTHTVINSRAQEPWSFGENAEAIVRKYIELRYRLLPYTYTAFQQAAETGLPIMRPLLLEYPDDPNALDAYNQTSYFWGDHILVAPVTRKGEAFLKVYLPRGQWYDFWSDKRLDGGQYIYVDTPLHKLPLFIRAGAVIPMREVQQFTGEKPLKLLKLHLYPGEKATSWLYEDDGQSFNYEKGEWCKTRYTLRASGQRTVLEIREREGQYVPAKRELRLILHGKRHPVKQISVDGRSISQPGRLFDPETQTTDFNLPDDGKAHEVVWVEK
ncbi:MAG: DUF5110 domain-containing protein [Calditrichaeota bacterium]|nr:MAG: DUF5110 domain-containing protein [Calditrichota bacterium]